LSNSAKIKEKKMFFGRIERELIEGTPWDNISPHTLPQEVDEHFHLRDSWEVNSNNKCFVQQYCISDFILWRNLSFIKRPKKQ
jgi:hypothetical protein